MANKKITDLTELTAVASDDYLEIVDTSANTSNKISRENLAGWHFLTTPLTSTSWDGDAFSTTAKTKIDLSTVFGAPAGIKAVLVRLAARDSGASGYDAYFGISPNDVAADLSLNIRLQGHGNDQILESTTICPCDANGDIYYQTKTSNTGTLDCWLWIWGYWL